MWTYDDCLRIEELAGGKKNIAAIYNCFTRVHIQIKEIEKISEARKKELEKVPSVKGLLIRGNELQLIVGTEAKMLSDQCKKHLGFSD